MSHTPLAVAGAEKLLCKFFLCGELKIKKKFGDFYVCTEKKCAFLHIPVSSFSNAELLREVAKLAQRKTLENQRYLSAYLEEKIVAAIKARK